MKEQKRQELFQEVRYEFLENIATVCMVIFMMNPFFNMILKTFGDYFSFMYMYNGIVLALGFFLMTVYVCKKWSTGQLSGIKERLKNHIAVTLFFVFAALMIITTLLNGAPEIALWGHPSRSEGLKGFLSYVMYFLLATFLLPERNKKWLVYPFLVTSTLVGIVIFADYIFLNQAYNYAQEGNRILHNSNHLGYYLLMSVMVHGMLFVTTKKLLLKAVYLGGFMLMTTTLIMNNTWGCQLALLIGIIFTMIVYSVGKGRFQRITLLLLPAMIATFVLAYVSDERLQSNIEVNLLSQISEMESLFEDEVLDESMGSGRMGLWLHTLEYIGERPLIGYGADVTGERLTADAGNCRCHCEFLDYAVNFGVPAALIYMTAIFMVYLRGLHHKEELTEYNYLGLCVAFAYLASSLVGNSKYYTAPFLFVFLGMGYVRRLRAD